MMQDTNGEGDMGRWCPPPQHTSGVFQTAPFDKTLLSVPPRSVSYEVVSLVYKRLFDAAAGDTLWHIGSYVDVCQAEHDKQVN